MKLNKNILELYFKLLPVQIFLVITNGLTSLINGLIIGNLLSPASMVAMGFGVPLIAIVASFASIISGGSGILCGNYMGRGESEKVNNVYTVAMIVDFVLGAILTAIVLIFANPLASLFGATPDSVSETASYMRGIAIGIIPMLVMPTQMTILQMCNKSNFSLISTIIFAIFTIIFCMMSLQTFNAGIFGVAFGTSLARFVVVIIIIVFIRMSHQLVRFDIHGFEMDIFKNLIILGTPAAFSNLLYAIRNICINTYGVAVGGNDAINSLAILSSVGTFYDSFNIGILNATLMLASVFIGERNGHSLSELMDISIIVGEILAVLKVVVTLLFGTGIAKAFAAQGEVINMTRELLLFYAVSAIFNMFTVTIMSVYQALGRVKFCNLLYPINCIIVPLFCCAVMTKFFGVRAIWALYAAAEVVTLLCIYLYSSYKKGAPAKNWYDIMWLDDNFNLENKISLEVESMDEVVTLAHQIQDFCEQHGINKKTAMLSGLCMEEMAGNVVEHGFTKDNKKHRIDVFVSVEDDEVSMRLRDDCIPFDPYDKLKMYNDDDPTKNVGIKMVTKLAKEMNYQTNFGMNVLIIKVAN